MKSSTVEMLRAHLLVASLSATFIDAAVLVACALGVPERVFESALFRGGVLAAIGLALVVTRSLARLAFRSAVAGRYAIVSDTPCKTVSLSADCPLRLFVIFHLRLNCDRLALAAQ